jgi:hypothetical protein
MWLATRYGWFSLACAYRDANSPAGGLDKNKIMIRARKRSHLERLKERFGMAEPIIETPLNDYRFRLIVKKADAQSFVAEAVREMTWSNFKNEAEAYTDEPGYTTGLHEVWGVMRRRLA